MPESYQILESAPGSVLQNGHLQSERGDRFVETLLTVIETCQKQGRSVLQFVTQALRQTNATTQNQSLLPNTP